MVAVVGYFVLQTYGTPQNIQNEASKVINNTGSTIQRLSSESQQSISNLQNSVTSSTNKDTRVPIAVYNHCRSFIRTDLKTIDTSCNDLYYHYYKQFKFNVPDVLENAFPGQAFSDLNSTIYQYGTNDFKIGLHDQVGEKNYTVSLWQLPQ